MMIRVVGRGTRYIGHSGQSWSEDRAPSGKDAKSWPLAKQLNSPSARTTTLKLADLLVIFALKLPFMASTVDDLDKLLNREATALQRDLEVDRILKAFKLNPYDVLDLDGKATPDEIKKKYRQISLCKHFSVTSLPFAKASHSSWSRAAVCPLRGSLYATLPAPFSSFYPAVYMNRVNLCAFLISSHPP
jgi:hypothetical protein